MPRSASTCTTVEATPLTNRVAEEQCVRGDGASGFGVGNASDGVDHWLTIAVDGDLQTLLGSGLDEPVDGLLDLVLDVGHDRSPPRSWPGSVACFRLR